MKRSGDFRTAALGVVLLFFVGINAQDPSGEDSLEFDESFDPNTLTEPSLEWPVILRPGETLPLEGDRSPIDTTREGYRIQVISTPDYETADSLLTELAPLFDQQVYLTFDPPNYKVRAGNFKFRSSAEDAQTRLRQMGFESAWIIRSRIETVPPE